MCEGCYLHSLPCHVLPYAALPIPQVHGDATQAKLGIITVQIIHEMPLCGFKGRQSPEHVGQSRILLHVDLHVDVIDIRGFDSE